MKIDHLALYYVIEAGEYALYAFEDGRSIRRESSTRLAVAYDSNHLTFYRLGEASEVMRWGAEKRRSLVADGLRADAENLAVVMLPRRHDADEFNRLLADNAYITTFLQKAGVI